MLSTAPRLRLGVMVLSCFWNSNSYQLLGVLSRGGKKRIPFSQSPWKEKGAAVSLYSKIAMAKLGAAVGNACVPAYWEQGHIQVVSYSLEMLAGLLALSFKWFGITVWKVATDLRTRDFERPWAEMSNFLTEGDEVSCPQICSGRL